MYGIQLNPFVHGFSFKGFILMPLFCFQVLNFDMPDQEAQAPLFIYFLLNQLNPRPFGINHGILRDKGWIQSRLLVSVNREKIILRTMWTGTVKLCEMVRTGVNWKHTLVSVPLKKKYVNRCEPTENNMWTGVNRCRKLCELVRTMVRTN